MINYYIETYKNFRETTSTKSDWKRILFAVGMVLAPSFLLLANVSWIAIHEIITKNKISPSWIRNSYIMMIIYGILIMLASFIDNRWKSTSYVLEYNDRIEKLLILKQKINDEYKFNNKAQYEMILEKIKSEKDKIKTSSDNWYNKSKKAFYSIFIVIFVALTPATITGLMNNYGKKEEEIINRKEFLDSFFNFIIIILFSLLFFIVLGIALGYLYSSTGKKHVRLLEDFENDIQIIIEIDAGLHPYASKRLKEMRNQEEEKNKKYEDNANKARKVIDINSI